MAMFRRNRDLESWEEMRKRMLDETSAYLSECLEHPELAPRIPVVESKKANFPNSLTPAFWNQILFGD